MYENSTEADYQESFTNFMHEMENSVHELIRGSSKSPLNIIQQWQGKLQYLIQNFIEMT